jgi:hypothetical protein
LLSHLLVAALVVLVLGRRSGVGGKLLLAVIGVYAHEQFDAPVARTLSGFGI